MGLLKELCLASWLFQAAASSSVSTTCKVLDSIFKGQVFSANTPGYNASLSSYYSGQESDLRPGCIFTPTETSHVATFVKLANPPKDKNGVKFAIRSGGHTIWPGAANIDNGITLDLRRMNQSVLNQDRTVASLGPGGIWSEIYPTLVPFNLTVMGGRVAGIGVGGFLTGGGINYLSRRYGWGCDQVLGYEFVLATGEIIYATAHNHADLWLALKGGSNNFGIVTRFDVATRSLGTMWTGSQSFAYTTETLQAQAQAFNGFMDPRNFDDAADMGLALVFQNPGGVKVVGNSLFYAEPVANPPVYQSFTSIPGALSSGSELTDVGGVIGQTTGTLPPNATRAIDIVYSYKNPSADIYQQIFKLWEAGTEKLLDVEGLQLVLLIQPHPVTNGTNSLGLPAYEKDIVMNVLTAAYTHKEDDIKVQREMQAIVDQQKKILKSNGVLIPFEYLNYADKSQNPIGSYGPETKARLQAVSRKYDPAGVFQHNMPGGFKLFN